MISKPYHEERVMICVCVCLSLKRILLLKNIEINYDNDHYKRSVKSSFGSI